MHFQATELFQFHKLNEDGIAKAKSIQETFEATVEELENVCKDSPREFAIVKTKLEEACFFAKKAMAIQEKNQAE